MEAAASPAVFDDAVAAAASDMTQWLVTLPRWVTHPLNPSGTVAAHAGPTLLSEHDCVLHFARFLSDAGVSWEDIHLELSPGQWMFDAVPSAGLPRRIDLAIIPREHLLKADLPRRVGDFAMSAVFEFAHASSHWKFGAGSGRTMQRKVEEDIVKAGTYIRTGIARRAYVVVIEECDHGFPADLATRARDEHGVEVLVLPAWT